MDSERIFDLKKRLASATDLGAYWTFYFDHFAEDPEFISAGRRVAAKQLHEPLAAMAAKALNVTTVNIDRALFTELPEARLIHGSCYVNGRILCVLFFLDLDMGTIALSMPDGITAYARFSITERPARMQ
ncbi:MAG: hypothetical protein IANPNBLG_03674 [Bryobacteraceae bacterium]|nr:hypothetical protein [Bryobacteraceae bacterium]